MFRRLYFSDKMVIEPVGTGVWKSETETKRTGTGTFKIFGTGNILI